MYISLYLSATSRYLSERFGGANAAAAVSDPAASAASVSIRAAPFVGQSKSSRIVAATKVPAKDTTSVGSSAGGRGRGDGGRGRGRSGHSAAATSSDGRADNPAGSDEDAGNEDDEGESSVAQQEALLREVLAAHAVAQLVASGHEEDDVAVHIAHSLEEIETDDTATVAAAGTSAGSSASMLAASVALRGQTQKQQQAVMEGFRRGTFNVLVATCIGEVRRASLSSCCMDLLIYYMRH
jgi:ERCC4-related helicase